MRKLLITIAVAALALLGLAGSAQAEFGIDNFDVTYTNADGTLDTQAGSHPFEMTTSFEVHNHPDPGGPYGIALDELSKDVLTAQMPGLGGNPYAVPSCPNVDFLTPLPESNGVGTAGPNCAPATVLGTLGVTFNGTRRYVPIFNLPAPPGKAAALGFWVALVPFQVQVGLGEHPPYKILAGSRAISQVVEVDSAELTLWGVPADPVHNPVRGGCLDEQTGKSRGLTCPANVAHVPFLTMPRACQGPLATEYQADSWVHPGAFLESGEPDLSDPNWATGSVLTHDDSEPPNPLGLTGCPKLAFSPGISAEPTSKAASSPTGLDFSLNVNDQGIGNPEGFAGSDIEKAVVTLPEGMSANPSIAEGLEVCTEADLEAETAFSSGGEGCPNASKIGSVEIETPLLPEKLIKGALYIAKPYENPFNSLLAMYIVIKNPELGISVTQPLKITPDPVTGQLTTYAEELPQLPFSHFRLHFREGARSPLTTPQACGTYNATATLYPWSGSPPIVRTSAFQIISGPDKGPCPSGGLPPFKPGLNAGTNNNRAGSFSPFYLRLFRNDSEQEITHFSIKLPPGVAGKLAGIPFCTDAEIEAAKARTGAHGGQEELDNPSCPKASEIGHTLAGAGVGPSLTYAPGKVYLAGPYHGNPLSMVAITAGKVGPFDIGTVVIREAFQINPETAEVFIDSTGSDPIPHIIRGIPVHLRDIRAYVDRPEFVINPTDCSPTSTASTVLGSGLDFVSEADDNPITVTSRFQAADCAALTFAPQLSFRLIGKTNRGGFPAFSSHLAMNGIGESGIDHASVQLPHTAFVANAHFGSICTRVQFKEGAGNGANCPANSIYGHARAVTPLLEEPLEGPVLLRSNGEERQLPDIVAALHNKQVDFDLVGYVDSVKGALRTTFATAPDAPVTSFDLQLEGGAKGLIENSDNLCRKPHYAQVHFAGQNGKEFASKPVMAVKCKHKAKKHHKHRKARHKRQAGRASR